MGGPTLEIDVSTAQRVRGAPYDTPKPNFRSNAGGHPVNTAGCNPSLPCSLADLSGSVDRCLVPAETDDERNM